VEKGLPNPAKCALRHYAAIAVGAKVRDNPRFDDGFGAGRGGFASGQAMPLQRRGLAPGGATMASAKLVRMSKGFFSSCSGAKACAVRSHDQGAWVWRRRS